MSALEYLFVRLWAPEDECQDSEKAHYVTLVDNEVDVHQWTLTRVWKDAHFFKRLISAQRVLRGVQRIKSRLERGWLYEIICVSEEIVDSNVPVEEEEEVSA
jgi:hypothetical protein